MSVAKAQDTVTGALEGLVAAPIKGASVRIVNDLSKIDVVQMTDAKGRFYRGLLPPGTYTLTFSAEGYRPRQVLQRLLAPRVNEVIPLPLLLEPDKAEPDQRSISGGNCRDRICQC